MPASATSAAVLMVLASAFMATLRGRADARPPRRLRRLNRVPDEARGDAVALVGVVGRAVEVRGEQVAMAVAGRERAERRRWHVRERPLVDDRAFRAVGCAAARK